MLIVLSLFSLASASDLSTITEVMSHRTDRLANGAPIIPMTAYETALSGVHVANIARVEGVSAAKAWGVAIIDQPVETVWMAINDDAVLADYLPVERSLVVSGSARRAPRRVFEYLSLPIINDRWWMVDVDHNAALFSSTEGLAWEQVWTDATHESLPQTVSPIASGGIPVHWTHGSWLLIDLPSGRTLVEYYVWIDPGGAIPASSATLFASGAVKDTLRAVDTVSAQASTWSHSGFVRPDGTAL